MTRRYRNLTDTALASVLVGLAVLVLSSSAPAADRPNIVLIISDDHGWPYYGFTGSDVVQTPQLDRLATEGTTFPHTFNTSSRCRPSLRSILTGLYPHQFALRSGAIARAHRRNTGDRGYPIEQMATLPRLLAKAGYATFQAGKLWDGTHLQVGFEDGMTRTAVVGPPSKDTAVTLGRETLEPVFSFLRRKRDEPFFLWFAPQLPHVPHDAPEKYRVPYEKAGWSGQALDYFAMCTWSDEIIGRLLTFLDERGLRDDTLVVYLSDNGWEHAKEGYPGNGGRNGKGSMHELGFRTPMIFRWPGHIPPARQIDAPVSTVDLFPTLLHLAGAGSVPGRSGIDLGPTLRGGHAPERTQIIGAQFVRQDRRRPRDLRSFEGDAYYLRDEDWYYILYGGELRKGVLFDKRTDPDEQTDVSHLHPERVRRYREDVLSWLDEIGVGRRRLGWVPAAERNRRRATRKKDPS